MATQKFKNDVRIEGEILVPNETASRAAQVDSFGKLKSSSVTSTELGYLSGVSSAVQTQINSKIASTDAIHKDGSVAFTADQSLGGFKLTNLAAPVSSSDAATKGYVDNALEGLKPKAAVRAATTANINLSTDLENGDSLDGITLATGDRVLVKDQSTASQNGIYIVSASGAASRATDFDSLSPIDEINKSIVAVQEGTANAGRIYVQYGTVSTLGTDAINFTYFNSVSGLIGGDGISVTGSTIDVDHDGQGLQISGGQLSLELNGSTLSKSASGLKLGDTAVTPGSYGSSSQAGTFTVDQQGRLTAASNTSIDHDALTNFVANEHIDHSSVSITTAANSGLAGGGDLTTSRSLTIDASNLTASTSADDADSVVIYDNSASGTRKMTRANFLSGVGGASAGDINETSFSAANNQAVAANVTGLAFSSATVRMFEAIVSVSIDATSDLYEAFTLVGVNKGSSFDMAVSGVGDDSGIVFTIDTAGQVKYTSTNVSGFVSNTIKFRARTLTV